MMGLVCPSCQRELLFSGEPPSFCGYCRGPLPKDAASSLADGPTLDLDAPGTPRFAAGEIVGEYRLGPKLGAGGMGTVHEAIHVTTGQRVAIKVLAPRLSGDAQQMERFRQEGRLASQINHARCVFVYAADEFQGRPYIVMELMAGTTLEDQIKGQGRPLPVPEAVDRILEVIDGLGAAHRLGVLHRDVKPSNCFLLDDGTVKVGDFGLSKLLEHEANFTEPGAYKGTVTFSPLEQLRNEPLDLRADVYSVTATLFYLLTGRAPFEGDSWVTAVARAASESPPDVRRFRPDVPRALARIIQRGLHPDRTYRFQNLDELRHELLSRLPARLNAAGVGLRIGAFLVDESLLALQFLIPWQAVTRFGEAATELTWLLTSVLYFGVLEGAWGASIGKWLLRLRLSEADRFEAPGTRRAAVRALVVCLALVLPPLAAGLMPRTAPRLLIQVSATLAGLFTLAWPMRPRNGFRGLHDLWTGTRVVQLPWPEPPLTYPALRATAAPAPLTSELPRSLGPYRVDGVRDRSAERVILVATDEALGRALDIVLQRPDSMIDSRRRGVARPTRQRWLAAGTWNNWAWDAFIAGGGAPLCDVVPSDSSLPWSAARPVLEQLTTELFEAESDGTLPPTLSIDQVQVREDGRVQLLDWPRAGGETLSTLALTHHAAILLLEGRLPSPGELPRAIRAPVPAHAVPILDRLMGVRDPAPSLAAFVAQLDATRDRPRRVNFGQKTAYLAILVALNIFGLASMFSLNFLLQAIDRIDQASVNEIAGIFVDVQTTGPQTKLLWVGAALSMPVIFWPAAWALWAFFFRGGFALRFAGLRLVRRDGRPASRLQCALRTVIVWMPITLLLLASNLLRSLGQQDLGLTVSWCALGVLGAYVYFSLLYPARSVHDWIAGTRLVPE
jgi:uncharacterized RDD family membrane protein YckC